jgi:hypothetical protein
MESRRDAAPDASLVARRIALCAASPFSNISCFASSSAAPCQQAQLDVP